jgi:stress-induced-phosphoprotein 1
MHYHEEIRRNHKNARVYSNRAYCYTNLGNFPEGLKDANKCIEMNPLFTEGYSRKVVVQYFMNEYDKALENYQEGLSYTFFLHEDMQDLMHGGDVEPLF